MGSAKEQFQLLQEGIDQLDRSEKRQDSLGYQQELTRLLKASLELKHLVNEKLALFSDNEQLEDIATSSLQFLALDYYLAQCFARKQRVKEVNTHGTTSDGCKWKIQFLSKAVQLHVQFMMSLYDYGLLDDLFGKILESLADGESLSLENLFPQPKSSTDISGAYLKRQTKIEVFQRGRAIEEQLSRLKKESKVHEEEHEDDTGRVDEELLRKLYLTQLKDLSYRSFHEVEGILMELELLRNLSSKEKLPSLSNKKDNQDNGDVRPFEYTDKLETLNKPILSKNGRVLRNFTLIDKRNQLKKSVFGYGQYGPTMTVEELLEQELENGRIVQGGHEPDEEPDEDNEEWQDKETYKAREWDEFKEANPRGSGNTLNNG